LIRARATDEDRRVLETIQKPLEERYETPAQLRGILLYRARLWAQRVGATEEETNRVIETLGLDGEDAREYADRFMARQ
jgi:hypothetical protein